MYSQVHMYTCTPKYIVNHPREWPNCSASWRLRTLPSLAHPLVRIVPNRRISLLTSSGNATKREERTERYEKTMPQYRGRRTTGTLLAAAAAAAAATTVSALPEIAIIKRDGELKASVRARGVERRADGDWTLETNVFDVATWSTGGAYYANVTVGTPPQPQVVILDTGSADLYFDSANSATCQTTGEYSCRGGTFSPDNSSTYKLVDPSPETIIHPTKGKKVQVYSLGMKSVDDTLLLEGKDVDLQGEWSVLFNRSELVADG
ncbi:hypothetical protein KC318_g23 [Hortaea werneckii]|nr:hypothetical protein KC334_g22 [Hortaea werneckii]KAI7028412.1 hypothetical protein KC355_g24 [Hortaea werneckii]KAI7676755.1 hypothetical protein KC318_g23 [Hortaea werneckii]